MQAEETRTTQSTDPVDPIQLSQVALRSARLGNGREALAAIASLSPGSLARALTTDAERLAFWINVYNAGIQHQLRRDPSLYERRFRFFAGRGVTVAGRRLSFNAIEHGLLRRSMFGYSLGYIANPFPNRFEKLFRLADRDPRVHFALNCGALSCPPIDVYDPASIENQLDAATESYLRSECHYDEATGEVTVTRLFQWFRGDFGGKSGILALLKQFAEVPAGAEPRIRYGPYDWTMALD